MLRSSSTLLACAVLAASAPAYAQLSAALDPPRAEAVSSERPVDDRRPAVNFGGTFFRSWIGVALGIAAAGVGAAIGGDSCDGCTEPLLPVAYGLTIGWLIGTTQGTAYGSWWGTHRWEAPERLFAAAGANVLLLAAVAAIAAAFDVADDGEARPFVALSVAGTAAFALPLVDTLIQLAFP